MNKLAVLLGMTILAMPLYASEADTQSEGEGVVYDLTLTKGKPMFRTDTDPGIVTPANDLEVMVLTTNIFGLRPKEDAMVTWRNADGSFETQTRLRFNMESDQSWTGNFTQFKLLFSKFPDADGEYTLTIPEGSFGDAEWIADPATGHANKELQLVYVFEGFDNQPDLRYDLAPVSVDPQPEEFVSDLKKISLVFPTDVFLTGEGSFTLSNMEIRYKETPEVEVNGNRITLTFANPPQEFGVYSLMIDPGTICNEEASLDPESGRMNDMLTFVWNYDLTNSVRLIDATSGSGVIYDLNGVKAASGKSALPAGIYILDGKRILVR